MRPSLKDVHVTPAGRANELRLCQETVQVRSNGPMCGRRAAFASEPRALPLRPVQVTGCRAGGYARRPAGQALAISNTRVGLTLRTSTAPGDAWI